jgi:predicted porin
MKKLLIATAALAMVAGTAQAQSSVTVYGVIDTGYNSLENKNSGTASSTHVIGSTETNSVAGGQLGGAGEAASSRFGLRGTEDLGGGLKANFVIETQIGAQNSAAAGSGNGSTNIGDRAFWAGLQDAKMGELRIGRQDTFTRSNWLAHDQLAFANVAGNLAHSGNGSGATTQSHLARNIAVNYLSPRFSGVQLSLGMTQSDSEVTGSKKTETGTGSQVGLNYTAGKFSAGAAYMEATTAVNAADATVFKDTSGNNTTTVNAAAVKAADTKTKDTSVAASYDFGFAKVAYIYNKRDSKDKAQTFSAGNIDRESNAFSASFPLTPKLVGRLGYGYGEYKIDSATAAGYKGDIKGYQAALNYNLSKRTMVYGIYGNEKRDISSSSDVESKEYSVGVRHVF